MPPGIFHFRPPPLPATTAPLPLTSSDFRLRRAQAVSYYALHNLLICCKTYSAMEQLYSDPNVTR